LDILEYIPKGKENAISTLELMNVLNCDMRELRKIIADLRNHGHVICSCSKGGYYKPKTRSELQESVKMLSGKAISIFKALRSQKKALKECEGQESLELNV